MTDKRARFQAVLDGETVDQIPTGFWYHFFRDELVDASGEPELIAENINGHKGYIAAFDPDFIKLMSDGFFIYPGSADFETAADDVLLALVPLTADHPWISGQVDLVKSQRAQFIKDIFSFYNIFAPATYLKFSFDGDDKLVAFIQQHDAKVVAHVFDVVSQSIANLAVAVIQEGGTDGIYYSTQNIQSTPDPSIFETYVKPSDFTVLSAAQGAGGTNVLHICGYEGASNQLGDFTDYPADIVNWATAVEGFSLSEGRQIFPDKVLLGGFGNTTKDVLYAGSPDEIAAETQAIIASFGQAGNRFLIGADCTVPRGTSLAHLEIARQAAKRVVITA
ncbi:MAG: uroporphyrinogen decarboxylase [Streptococcaceae bacterium]|jgi:uroporphyrinogen decarboxylase|nr:uroporphyrinogen decarboxylase [Streptococcaceae bacterium]